MSVMEVEEGQAVEGAKIIKGIVSSRSRRRRKSMRGMVRNMGIYRGSRCSSGRGL